MIWFLIKLVTTYLVAQVTMWQWKVNCLLTYSPQCSHSPIPLPKQSRGTGLHDYLAYWSYSFSLFSGININDWVSRHSIYPLQNFFLISLDNFFKSMTFPRKDSSVASYCSKNQTQILSQDLQVLFICYWAASRLCNIFFNHYQLTRIQSCWLAFCSSKTPSLFFPPQGLGSYSSLCKNVIWGMFSQILTR